MPFDHCAECRRCCYVEQYYPPHEIPRASNEKKKFGGICIETQCTNLGPSGCTLGDDKPFSCTLYPLAYDPEARHFYYDIECPLMPEYIRQLKKADSEAARHLAACKKEIARLEKSDSRFLISNFAIDADYFDLKKLPTSRLGESAKQ